MLKLLNNYEALKICDMCGKEEIILKASYQNILRLKTKEHHCRICINKTRIAKEYKYEIKSMFIPIGKKYKSKGHLPQAKWKTL